MKWFEMGYDRGNVADRIMSGTAEDVCPGYRRTQWRIPDIGGLVMLHHYDERTIYDEQEGVWTKVQNPFYRAFTYYVSQAGTPINEIVDFNADHSYLVRSSQQLILEAHLRDPENNAEPEVKDIWDSAMSVLDESLAYRSRELGMLMTARMVERPVYVALAA